MWLCYNCVPYFSASNPDDHLTCPAESVEKQPRFTVSQPCSWNIIEDMHLSQSVLLDVRTTELSCIARYFRHAPIVGEIIWPGGLLVCSRARNFARDGCMSEIFGNIQSIGVEGMLLQMIKRHFLHVSWAASSRHQDQDSRIMSPSGLLSLTRTAYMFPPVAAHRHVLGGGYKAHLAAICGRDWPVRWLSACAANTWQPDHA